MGTAKKVERAEAFREADFAGKSAPDDYFNAAHAWSRMQNRITPSLAEELGCARQTFEDYGNPNRRKRGPHLLLLQALEIALELKPRDEQRHDVLAPLDFIEARLGRLAIDVSQARDGKSPASRAQCIAKLLVEFSQFVDAVDDPAQLDELGRLHARQQLQDVVREATELLEVFPDSSTQPPSSPDSGVAQIRAVRS